MQLESVDWINVTHNGNHLWALVNIIMNLGGSIKTGNFLIR